MYRSMTPFKSMYITPEGLGAISEDRIVYDRRIQSPDNVWYSASLPETQILNVAVERDGTLVASTQSIDGSSIVEFEEHDAPPPEARLIEEVLAGGGRGAILYLARDVDLAVVPVPMIVGGPHVIPDKCVDVSACGGSYLLVDGVITALAGPVGAVYGGSVVHDGGSGSLVGVYSPDYDVYHIVIAPRNHSLPDVGELPYAGLRRRYAGNLEVVRLDVATYLAQFYDFVYITGDGYAVLTDRLGEEIVRVKVGDNSPLNRWAGNMLQVKPGYPRWAVYDGVGEAWTVVGDGMVGSAPARVRGPLAGRYGDRLDKLNAILDEWMGKLEAGGVEGCSGGSCLSLVNVLPPRLRARAVYYVDEGAGVGVARTPRGEVEVFSRVF